MTPALSIRRPLALGLCTLALLLAALGGWGHGARLSGAVVAPGRVEVAGSHAAIQHPVGGTLAQLAVAEGDRVTAGQTLAVLADAALGAERAVTDARLQDLAAHRLRLLAEAADAPALHLPPALAATPAGAGQAALFQAGLAARARMADLRDRRAARLHAQIAGLAAETRAIDREMTLLRADLRDLESLRARGHAEAPRLRALARDAARLEGRRAALDASGAEAGASLATLEAEAAEAEARRHAALQAELRETALAEAELVEHARYLAGRQAGLTVTAPAAGRILGLTVSGAGAVIRPAETIAHIVPGDRPLVIAARVPPAQINRIRAGQAATIVPATTVDGQRVELTGSVLQLSADALSDPATGEAFFRVTIAPDAAGALLMPGMSADVFLRTADRSPLVWLTEPFTAYFARALREGPT